MALWNVIRLLYVYAYISWSTYMAKLLVILLEHLRSISYKSMRKIKIFEKLAEKPPSPSFLPFHERSDSCHTCEIPMVPILQIYTQIPTIRISSIGYQLCQLFKLLTYRKVQDTVSWYRWKPYRQPYHNTQ